jgi:hypothetical protein
MEGATASKQFATVLSKKGPYTSKADGLITKIIDQRTSNPCVITWSEALRTCWTITAQESGFFTLDRVFGTE